MIKTVNLTAEIKASREFRIVLPSDVPVGPADIVIVVSPHTEEPRHSLGDSLNSEFFGMWRDREDIGDSAEK